MRLAPLALLTGLALTSAGTRAADPPPAWEFVGHTEAVATVDVRPRATGELTKLAVRDGAEVKKGDLLAEIDPRPHQLELEAALGRVKAAEARLHLARLKTANARVLMRNMAVGADEVARCAAAETEAEAGVATARADADRAKLNLSYTKLLAPFDGRVSRVSATAGNLVVADQAPVLTVVSGDALYVTFNVPEGLVFQLRRDGLEKQLAVAVGFAGEGHPYTAKLDSIAAEVDPKTAAVRFRALLPNPKGLFLPGMSARVRLTAGKAPPPPPKVNADNAAKIKALQKERVATLRELVDQSVAAFRSGRAPAEAVLEAQTLLLGAEADAAETEADRVALYEKGVAALKEYEDVARAQVASGRAPAAALLAIQARRLDVEIRLERAKGRAGRP